jgi:hypothetical protein
MVSDRGLISASTRFAVWFLVEHLTSGQKRRVVHWSVMLRRRSNLTPKL